MKDDHINVFWSDEDRAYGVDIPDLNACAAFGATSLLALEEALKAKEASLAVAREHGEPIPRPSYRPAIYQAARCPHPGLAGRRRDTAELAEIEGGTARRL